MKRFYGITATELKVAAGITRGLRNKEIAVELGCCEKNIRHHVSAINRAWGTKSRTQILLKYVEFTTAPVLPDP